MAILTVYTKLLDKTLDEARIIDMGSTKTCQCYVLPYDTIAKVGKEYLAGKYAFYILLGNPGVGGPCAYIGQTNDFVNRVADHKQKKTWWKTACEAHNYRVENTKPIKEPGLSDDKKNDMELFFEEIKFLTRFYGCEIFEKRRSILVEAGFYHYFNLEVKKRGIKARIRYCPNDKSFVLMEGSFISAFDTSCSKKAKEIRKMLIEDSEICKREGNLIKILSCPSIPVASGQPSLPAEVITGTSMQGTTAFKDKDGKTFAEVYPKEKNE